MRTPDENLHRYTNLGHRPGVEAALSEGASLTSTIRRGIFPITRAIGQFFGMGGSIANGSEAQGVLGLLLERGALQALPAKDRDLVLIQATKKATFAFPSYLEPFMAAILTQGANLHGARKDGETALHIAFKDGWINWALLLITHGADPHRPNATGQTPLDLMDDVVLRRRYRSTPPETIRAEVLAHVRQVTLQRQPVPASPPQSARSRPRV